jgi:hypothetical protein
VSAGRRLPLGRSPGRAASDVGHGLMLIGGFSCVLLSRELTRSPARTSETHRAASLRGRSWRSRHPLHARAPGALIFHANQNHWVIDANRRARPRVRAPDAEDLLRGLAASGAGTRGPWWRSSGRPRTTARRRRHGACGPPRRSPGRIPSHADLVRSILC